MKKPKNWLYWVISVGVGLAIVLLVVITNNQQNKAIGDLNKASEEVANLVKTGLEKKGYEVIDFGLEDNIGFVKMKAFGDKTEQVSSGFIQLGVNYKNASEYKVTIMSDKSTCYYDIDGQTYRDYLSNITGESVMLIHAKIKNSERC